MDSVMYQTDPQRPPRTHLSTLYDLPSENPEDPDLPDVTLLSSLRCTHQYWNVLSIQILFIARCTNPLWGGVLIGRGGSECNALTNPPLAHPLWGRAGFGIKSINLCVHRSLHKGRELLHELRSHLFWFWLSEEGYDYCRAPLS